MASLFHKDEQAKAAPAAPTNRELIEKEITHLKKGTSVRHGAKGVPRTPSWLVLLALFTLLWLWLMDPPIHAWYKGESARVYLYLHNYSDGTMANELVATHILAPDEVEVLNHRSGSFQGYYASPDAAIKEAQKIIDYMNNVQLLHSDKYDSLDPLSRMRCLLFVRSGLVLPTRWDFLDPTITDY